MARTVTAHQFAAVNGVVESPDQWQFDRVGADAMALMGRVIGSVTDVVIGRTLWQKAGDGGDIAVTGGIETIRRLFLAGVVDTLTLTVHPVVGQGRRLFDDAVPVTRLELVDHQISSVGNAVLTYRLRDRD